MTRRLLGLTAAAALISTALLAAPVQAAPARALAGDLASTIALNNCSASLVRFTTSQSSDRAMMLTNGHCYEGGFLSAGQVLTDRASTRSGTLLNASGTSLGTVRAERIIYGTMTGTDVLLYRLNESFSSIQTRTGAVPLTIRGSKPANGTSMFIASGYWKRVYECAIEGFVFEMREGQWTWKDSIRYRKPCPTIGGTSGSPIVDSTARDLIGINNTKNENGQRCTLNNPCEVDQNGNITVDSGRSYGQQTWWFNTCLGTGSAIDLTKPGCLLHGASSDPGPGPNLLQNPGFESGAVNWTGTSGVITNNTGRPARTGTWKAWLGGNGTTSTEQIDQSVAIPSTATAPRLSFWLRTDTNESGSTVYDRLRIQVIDGATTTTLATFTNVGTNATYTQKSYDLTAYKGRTVGVRFLMTEDVSLQTSFVVDDTAVTTG